jgi:hypothetical protein
MDFAYYTCFFGSDSNWTFLIPPLPTSSYPCYFFTNNQRMFQLLDGTGWIKLWMDIPVYNDNVLDCRSTKELRACPHRFEPINRHKYLCWFDCKLKIDHEKVIDLVRILDTCDKCIVLNKHPHQYPTVWGEFEAAMGVEKYAAEREKARAYIERKIAENGSDMLSIHYCGGFHIRKLTDQRSIDFGESWYTNIQECGIEDQISLQCVHPHYTDAIHGVAWKACWDYGF